MRRRTSARRSRSTSNGKTRRTPSDEIDDRQCGACRQRAACRHLRRFFTNHVKNGEVDFNYQGRHQELTRNIAPEDVRWICELLARLRVEQWRDAFRAGGYEPHLAERFICRIREKIAEGLALAP